MIAVKRSDRSKHAIEIAALEATISTQRIRMRKAKIKRLKEQLFTTQEKLLEAPNAERNGLFCEVSAIRSEILRMKSKIEQMKYAQATTPDEVPPAMETPPMMPSEPNTVYGSVECSLEDATHNQVDDWSEDEEAPIQGHTDDTLNKLLENERERANASEQEVVQLKNQLRELRQLVQKDARMVGSSALAQWDKMHSG